MQVRYFVADDAYLEDVDGVAAHLTAGIYKELPGLWNTDFHLGLSEHQGVTFTTGWIKMSGIVGFGRARRLRILTSANGPSWNIGVSFGFDYADAYMTEQTLGVPGSGGSTEDSTNPARMIEATFPVQKCTAFRVKVREIVGGSELEGADFYGMSLVYSPIEGGRRVPTTRRF